MDQKPAALKKFDGARVLVVEDELINQMVSRQVLQKMSIEVTVVENGQQAIDAVVSDRFDLVLMDCQMPVMDGYAATRSIRANEQARGIARLPIIAFTAHAMRGDREVCIDAGMDDYLSKPFEIIDLQNILQQWLPEIS
jgi:CheY-like chemotaxis protein